MSARGLAPPLMVAALMVSGSVGADPSTPLPDSKARPDSIVFASIAWHTPADQASTQLAARGFAETHGARTKVFLAADGRLFEAYAVVHAGLDDHGGVVRWDIAIPSKGERNEYAIQRKIYDDAVTEMVAKYGRRQENWERFRFPYAKGDDNEARGVREGYVTISSAWKSKRGDRLQIALGNDMSVVLAYESRYWRKVEDERRKKKAKDL